MKVRLLMYAAVFALGACVTPQRRAEAPPAEERGPCTSEQAAARLARARERAMARERLSAVAQVRGVPGLAALGVTADIVAERPARLYVAARSFFGPPTDELWTDGDRYLWRSMRPGAGGSGTVTPQVLASLLPVPLPADQWVSLLFGLPLPSDEPETVTACAAGKGCGCLSLGWRDGRRMALAVAPDGTVTGARLDDEARGTNWHVDYQQPLASAGGLRTRLVITGEGLDPKRPPHVELNDVRLNGPPLPAALFEPLARR